MTAARTDVFVNFYEMLSVAPTADAKAIEERIKEETRTWRKRTGSPDLSKRQEAELRMQHLSAARDTLLDAEKRSAYDRRLATQRTEAPRHSAPTGDRNWVGLAEEYLAQNDYHSAAYAAREATQVEGNSPRAWNLRGRANAGLGNHNDALYEVRQAAEIEPNNAQYQFDMGSVCEQMERWKDALTAYETASRLEPSAILYRVSVAGVYLQNDLPEKAQPMLEELYRAHPADEMVNFYLAGCLHDLAEHVPHQRDDEGYTITSPAEIEKMEALVQRANGLGHNDRDVTANLASITAYIEQCKKTKFGLPPFMRSWSPIAILFVFLVPIIGTLVSLAGTLSGEISALGMLVVFGLWAFGLFKVCWVPMWKQNQRSLKARGVR